MSYENKITEKLLELKPDCYSYSIFGFKSPLSESKQELLQKLKYIPRENKNRILHDMDSIVTGNVKSVDTFMQVLAEKGYLKFKPYIAENSVGTPTLVLKHNRFVHLFRGYYFQVSYTADGIGEYRSANVRFDRTLSLLNDVELTFDNNCGEDPDCFECESEMEQALKQSRLQEIFCYMNCINACAGIDEFDKLLQESPEIVDAFVKASVKRHVHDFNLTYQELLSTLCVEATDMLEVQDPMAIYRLPVSDTQDACRLRIYDWDTVAVEVMQEKAYHEYLFKLPSFELSQEFAEKYGSVDWQFYFPEALKESLFLQFTSFILNFVGVVVNFTVAYNNKKDRTVNLAALNNQNVKTLETLDDLTGLYN